MTIAELKKTMTDAFIGEQVIKDAYGLLPNLTFEDQFSTVSIENILFTNVATGIFVLQEMFERHKLDIGELLKVQRAGSAEWYAWKALQFRLGQPLIPGSDQYDDTGLTPAQIAAMQIVKQASATEAQDRSVLYIKIAKETNGELTPLDSGEEQAFTDYMHQVSFAGVRYFVINQPADDMNLTMDIYYDPQVLDSHGRRLDGTNDAPVPETIRGFLKSLPFNGEYSNQALVDALQRTPGVVIAELKSAKSRYGLFTEWHAIDAREIPFAGYYTVGDADLNLVFRI
ncbi:MAG: hypothetical protein LBE91_14760 [Tannerella sp.]|jgi:hypothetical protein|nr:hypothetical protein [Tannerella sp.]